MPARRRSYILVPLFIVACSIGAAIFTGGGVKAATTPEDSVIQSLRQFTSVYEVVEKNFADEVKPDKGIYKGAIPGMLRELDPHSNFFDPRDYKILLEDQHGHYSGVGMIVQDRSSKTVVLTVFGGSPAYRAGLRPGDTILEVNDKKTDGLSTNEVADLLKGPRGTHVQVVVQRPGAEKPITFNAIREEINRSSVDGFMIKPEQQIAYIHIAQFNENTGKDMEDMLKKFGEPNLKGLILDLRDNPGGLLNEGVETAGHFLKKGDLVVNQHGRASPNKNYTAQHSGTSGENYPIVVVVDRYSASAAEIVTGALQDHDRALVFGENTFGKGLVQVVFPLNDNTGLALTSAQYYTPSGRFIQRPYSNISFLDYYYHNNLDQKNTQDVKMTDSGRTVYGGGGIAPDEKYDTPKLNPFQIQVLRNSAIFNFTAKYFGSQADLKLPKGWSPDEAVINAFHDFLMKASIPFTEAEFTTNHQWMKEQLRVEMYKTAFTYEESQRVQIEMDPEIAKAIDLLPKAKALLDNAKKMLVERMTRQERAALAH